MTMVNLREIPIESIEKSEKVGLPDQVNDEAINMSTELGTNIALARKVLSRVSLSIDGEETWIKINLGKQP